MINRYLKHFRHFSHSVVFAPADEADLSKIDFWLTDRNFSTIPYEYRKFLQLNDGLIFNGIEFYGAIPHYREDKNYTFPNLITVNEYYLNYDYFISKLVIGRISENILLYDGAENVYAITDRINLRPLLETENFTSFLKIFYHQSITNMP